MRQAHSLRSSALRLCNCLKSVTVGGRAQVNNYQMSSAQPTSPWKKRLVDSLKANKSLPYAKYMQVATVTEDGRPACRTVVFRGFLEEGEDITFVTDSRSRKVPQLAHKDLCAICWYFPNSREQYRIDGSATVVHHAHPDPELLKARQQAWTKMSDGGRAQFTWPSPGLPWIDDAQAFSQPAPPADADALETFCLVVLEVEEVEYLSLKKNTRIQFRKATAEDGTTTWTQENVNP